MNGQMIIVLLVVNVFYVVQSQSKYASHDIRQYFCGIHLENARFLACASKNAKNAEKRSAGNWKWNYEYDEDNASVDDGSSISRNENILHFPLYQRNSPNAYGTNDMKSKKAAPGIVDECCRSPCTLNYIAEWYCD